MQELEKEVSFKETILLIKEWATYISTKWKILLIAAVIGGVIGLVYSWKQKVTYTATTIYILEDNGASNSQNGSLALANQFGFGSGMSSGGLFAGANLTELIKSKLIFYEVLLSPVIVDGKLVSIADYYLQINNDQKKVQFKPGTDRKNLSREQILKLREIYSDLSSEEKLLFEGNSKAKKTSFSQVTVTSNNEEFAKVFCETIVNITSKAYQDSKVKKTTNNIQLIQKQIDSVRSTYSNTLIDQASATDNIFNLNPSLKSKGTIPTQKLVDVQSNSSVLNSLISSLENARTMLRNETPLFQVIESPELPLNKEVIPNRRNSIFLFSFLSLFITLSFIILKKLYLQLMQQ
jgi:hypothetical protein